MRATVVAAVWLVLSASLAQAQVAPAVAAAREALAFGDRSRALAGLGAHLADTPRDVDARLLYGLILSWEGRYDEARPQLQQVVAQAPAYTDARVALMNVAWWSGDSRAAREASNAILSADPGNAQARTVRDRLDATSRPWTGGLSYGYDAFSDGRAGWHESAASITRLTSRGSVIVRASDARRFGSADRQFEVGAYPRFRPGTYAFIGVGVAPDAALYPSNRISFDLYQALGAGVEVSGGFRRLDFGSTTNIFVGTLSKYVGNWMLTGKVFHVPGEGELDSTSYHGGFRRYVRGDGVSYVGAAYSHGFSREEIRNLADLTTLDSDSIRLDAYQQLTNRLRAFVTVSPSRQDARPAVRSGRRRSPAESRCHSDEQRHPSCRRAARSGDVRVRTQPAC